jgi:hypothetical protein
VSSLAQIIFEPQAHENKYQPKGPLVLFLHKHTLTSPSHKRQVSPNSMSSTNHPVTISNCCSISIIMSNWIMELFFHNLGCTHTYLAILSITNHLYFQTKHEQFFQYNTWNSKTSHNLIFIMKRINLSSLLQLYHNKIIILKNSIVMFITSSQELKWIS